MWAVSHVGCVSCGLCLIWAVCSGWGIRDARKAMHVDDCCSALAQLLQEPLFLTSMVHALEEQKTFTIQNKSDAALLPCMNG